MQALAKIHVIEGRPTQAAELMRALVLSKGHELIVEEYTQSRVILCGRRKESDHVTKVQWDLDMAKKAGLASKTNWQKYPRAMLLARATGELCRLIFADVIGGISYTPEELTDGDLVFFDEDIEAEPGPSERPRQTVTRKAAAAKKAAAPRPASASSPSEAAPPPLPGEDGFDQLGAQTAPPEAPTESDEIKSKRASQVAMRCNEAGLDAEGRHNLISAVTNGVKDSSTTVSGEEAAEVIAAAKEIAAGRKALAHKDDRWELIDVEIDPDYDTVGDEDSWSSDQWRAFLQSRQVKVTEAIKEAQRLAAEEGADPPGNLSALKGQTSVCGLLRGWVEEKFEERAGS